VSRRNRTLSVSVVVPAAAVLLSGCAGRLYTDLNPDLSAKSVQGVIAFEATNVIEIYQTTTLVDKDTGKLLGIAPDGCRASTVEKIATRVDFAKPRVIRYEPGFFDQNKFAIAFKENGQLASVNADSNPGAALAGLADVLPFVLKDRNAPASIQYVAPGADGIGMTPCNAGEQLTGVSRYPDIEPFKRPSLPSPGAKQPKDQ